MPLPTTQIGALSEGESVTLKTFPVPHPGPKEVLIQNVAVASNPKDWKNPFWYPHKSTIEGNDVAGYVVAVGEGVTNFKGGERVAALTKFDNYGNLYGAYAQYSIAPESTTFQVPESVSFEEASTIPLAYMTAALGLFKNLELPEEPKSSGQLGIILNGASTSVGAYVIQLAKRAGLFIIGTAGSSKEYARSLGVDVIVDYREYRGTDFVSALVEAAGEHPVSHVFDAVSENGSTLPLSQVLLKTSPDGKGKIVVVLPISEEEKKQVPQGITITQTWVRSAQKENEEFASRFYSKASEWLHQDSGAQLIPNRVKVMPDGLASVKNGLALLRDGKIHGEKLVYRVAETPEITEPRIL